jgi:hypothetical protein
MSYSFSKFQCTGRWPVSVVDFWLKGKSLKNTDIIESTKSVFSLNFGWGGGLQPCSSHFECEPGHTTILASHVSRLLAMSFRHSTAH